MFTLTKLWNIQITSKTNAEIPGHFALSPNYTAHCLSACGRRWRWVWSFYGKRLVRARSTKMFLDLIVELSLICWLTADYGILKSHAIAQKTTHCAPTPTQFENRPLVSRGALDAKRAECEPLPSSHRPLASLAIGAERDCQKERQNATDQQLVDSARRNLTKFQH